MSDPLVSGGHPALTDEQTGLPNRLHFDTVFQIVFAMGSRGIPLTILLLEIDGFPDWIARADGPGVNRTLRSIAATIRPVLRQTDLLARFDEASFIACLLDCNMAGGVLVADRFDGLLDSVREGTGLRFSLGGAVFDSDMENPADFTGAAKGALQNAKSRGGDQIEFSR